MCYRFGGSWESYLPIAEVSYNNNYHSGIGALPFELLYGQRCRSPVVGARLVTRLWGGPEAVIQTTKMIRQIRQRLQTAQSYRKSYADRHRSELEFQDEDMVLLKVSLWKALIRLRNRGKLGPRYIGLLRVIYRIAKVAYILDLPEEISQINNTFHVSQLRNCVLDNDTVVSLDDIQVYEYRNYV